MLNRVQLKAEAKSITKNAQVSAYLFTLLYLAISAALNGVNWLTDNSAGTVLTRWSEMTDVDLSIYVTLPLLRLPPLVATGVTIAISLVSAVLGAGYLLYIMGVRKGQEMSYATLFDGFLFAGKVILLQIVINIFVFLWSLLFVIPGIIAAYRYRFALYNLCDNPEIGVMEALNMSKAQTRGHKWELFVLDLSWIGWELLCALTLGILSIWITPYRNQTDIGYFEVIKRMSGIGFRPEDNDGAFRPDDRFDDGPRSYDPER